MTVGNPFRQILLFTVPVLLSQVFQQLYNTIDSLIVGRFLGTEALAAVSSSGTLIFLMVSFFMGTSTGAGVVIARYFGAGDGQKTSDAIHTNVAINLIFGLVLSLTGVLFVPTFLVWMRTDPEVLPLAVSYFRCYFAGGIFLVMYNVLRGTLNALGDSRRPFYYLVVSSVLNVLLDLLFVAVFRWGVWSAAFATVLSQSLSVLLCLFHLCRKGHVYTLSVRKIRIHRDMFREIMKNGVPSGIQNSVIGFANVLVQSSINTFGKFAMAAYGSYVKIEGFAFLPINSFTLAITTFISQNLGAGEHKRARTGARFGIICGVLSAETFGLLIWRFAPQLISLFDSTPEVLSFGTKQARTVALFYFLLAFSHCIAAVCRGAGKAFVPMLVMLSVWCVFRIIYIELVMFYIGDIGLIYWAYPITWTISSVIFACYYLFSDWVHGFDRIPGKESVRGPSDGPSAEDTDNN